MHCTVAVCNVGTVFLCRVTGVCFLSSDNEVEVDKIVALFCVWNSSECKMLSNFLLRD